MPDPLTIYECPECGSLDIERTRCESLPDHDRRRAAVHVFREDVRPEQEATGEFDQPWEPVVSLGAEGRPMPEPIETHDSLTLDVDARERATEALSAAIDGGWRNHFCAEWMVDDGCEICWDIAAQVVRAAEGLRLCTRCNGGGTVGPEGDCCPECGGDGLEPIPSKPKEEH